MSIITLTSDFGLKDYSVAAWKGKILSVSPGARLIDISHDITPFSIEEAAYIFSAAYKTFPARTIHMISVFEYYDAKNHFLVFKKNDHFFIGPNNGFFSLVFDEEPGEVFTVEVNENTVYPIQSTFGVIYDKLHKGLSPGEIGTPLDHIARRINLQPVVSGSRIRGSVIYIDQYGNAVVNISRDLFERTGNNKPFKVYFKRFDPITRIYAHYMQAEIGEPICTFNSQGYLELSVNLERADDLLGLKKGDSVQIEFSIDNI